MIDVADEGTPAEDSTGAIDEEVPTIEDEPALRAEETGWTAEDADLTADEMVEDSEEPLRLADRTPVEDIDELEEALPTLPGRAGTFLIPETVPCVAEAWNVIPEEGVPVSM
jgi:hypothetical protein